MAGQHLAAAQAQVLIQPEAQALEQGVEHPAHGQHRGAAIQMLRAQFDLAHLAAWCGGTLDHLHVQAVAGQQGGCTESPHARADHHHTGWAQAGGQRKHAH